MATSVILFGGTFDPPHIGHLTMAQLAWEQTQAAAVWFLPAPDPPHKLHEQHLAYELRVRLVEACIETVDPHHARFQVSTVEADLPVPSYTLATVRHCKEKFPDVNFQFLMGSDSLAQLATWHGAQRLTKEIRFLVAPRPQHPLPETLALAKRTLPYLDCAAIDMPALDLSSTWVRDRITQHLPMCGLVPQEEIGRAHV